MKEKINLQELTTLLSEKSGISKKEADVFLREFFGLMTDALIEDKIVKVRNLGTFKLSEVEARESVDVRNGSRLLIPAHTKISYTQDKDLNEIINKTYSHLEPKIIEELPLQEETYQEEIRQEEIRQEEIRQEEVRQEEAATSGISQKVEQHIEKQEQEQEPVTSTDIIPSDVPADKVPKSDKPLFEPYDDGLADEEIRRKRNRIITFITTFVIVAILIAVFYFLSQEPENTVRNYPNLSETTLNIAKETEEETETDIENSSEFEGTEEVVNPADTIIPIKATWAPGKKRKTKVGERLTLISFEEYGDVVFWIYIYDENKHLISKDNYVRAGVDLTIPPPEKYDIDAKNAKSLQKARDFAKNYNNNYGNTK